MSFDDQDPDPDQNVRPETSRREKLITNGRTVAGPRLGAGGSADRGNGVKCWMDSWIHGSYRPKSKTRQGSKGPGQRGNGRDEGTQSQGPTSDKGQEGGGRKSGLRAACFGCVLFTVGESATHACMSRRHVVLSEVLMKAGWAGHAGVTGDFLVSVPVNECPEKVCVC